MALSKILENSIAAGAVSSSKLKDFLAAVDLNGVELVLDADGDTTIHASTDDQIDFKIAGVEHISLTNSSGNTIIKPRVDGKDIVFQQFDAKSILEINDGGFVSLGNGASSGGVLRIYEDTDLGTNYVGLSVGNVSTTYTLALPNADGSSGQAITTNGSGVLSFTTISTAYDDLTVGDAALNIATSAGNITIDAQGNDTDIIFKGTDGNADRVFMTIDGSAGGDLFLTGGLIDLKNDGSAVSQIKFYCESSNAHAQTLIGAPHSESGTNTLTLPSSGGNSKLVSATSTATLTNKTLTSPVISTITGATITLDSAGDINLDADGADIVFKDGGTQFGKITNASTHVTIFDGTTLNTTMAGANITFAGTVGSGAITSSGLVTGTGFTAGSAVLAEAELELLDGLTAGTAIASKVVTTDSSIDTSGQRNLTISGELDAATLDISGAIDIAGASQFGGTITVGANDAGHDVIFHGNAASANVTFDASADDLIFNGGAGLIVPDGQFTLASTAVTSTAAELNKLDGAGVLKQAGKETIWIPAQAMTPTASNGCAALATVETTSGRPDMNVLDFDKDSDEFAQFAVAFPKSYNLGTVTFQFFWSGIAATTGVELTLAGVAMNDNQTIDVAYGTAVAVADDAQGAVEELLVSAESGAITIAGTMADNDLAYFRIGRDVSADNMAGDCRLHGIKLHFTTDAANDA